MHGEIARSPIVAALVAVATVALSPGVALAAPAVATRPASAFARATYACTSEPTKKQDGLKEPAYAVQRFAPARLAPLATGRGIIIAEIDSGVDANHPQLDGKILPGKDFLHSNSDARQDCNGHGTGVASIMVAAQATKPDDRKIGFQGLAPNAKILPIRVSEQEDVNGPQPGSHVTSAVLGDAIQWAVAHDAKVINMSLTLDEDNAQVRDAVRYAIEHDVVVVAAVGNKGGADYHNIKQYPAAYDGVLGVGSIGADGVIAPYSNYGPAVDVVAPGQNITMAAVGDGYRLDTGTSYAAPYVAATVALVRERFPDLDVAGVLRRINATADLGAGGQGSPRYGSGVVNPYRALTETVSDEKPRPLVAAPSQAPDLAAAGLRQRRHESRSTALIVAGVGFGAAVLAALAGAVLPRGKRRRWRAGTSA
jgi:membrane-anchored mycosin MYCP